MSQLLPVLNARIGSDPIRGDLRSATRDEVERAYTRQIEADEQELKQHDLSAIEPSTEFGHAPFDLAFSTGVRAYTLLRDFNSPGFSLNIRSS